MSFINPLQIVEMNPVQNTAIYATRWMDNYLFSDQIYKFQNKIQFLQQWVLTDIIHLQFESDYAPITLVMEDQYGRQIAGKSASMTAIRANKYIPGLIVYEAALSVNGLGSGPYRYVITPGNDPSQMQITEWFTILRSADNTIRLDYSHNQYHEDVLFETGIVFSLRIPGYIEYMAPGNKIVTIEDQPLNQTTVSARSFRNIQLHIGDGSGVPPWLIDKINRAWTCDNCSYDGKLLAVNDGKWTEAGDPDMQLKAFSGTLRESLNRSSKVVRGTTDPNKRITLIYGIDGRLYSDVSANAGETVIQILGQE